MRNFKISSFKFAALAFALLLSTVAAAQAISGSVTNKTTGKPAAGVDVALVDPMQGMAEVTSTKTGSDGSFTLKPTEAAQGPRLVRTTKDGVNYFKFVPPGTSNVSAEVYDGAAKVDGIAGTVDVMKVQAESGTLRVTQLIALRNTSNPPRTLNAPVTFEFVLPEGAQIDGGNAQGPGGQPIQATPTPTKQKNHYTFDYALKPGETRFELGYHMPYSGSATFKPVLLQNFDHFVVVMPASMKWQAKGSASFQPMQDTPDTQVQVVQNATPSQDLAFNVSGTGTIAEQQDAQGGGPMGAGGGAAPAMGGGGAQQQAGPGGGLGAPIDAPDALESYRWPILGMFAIILAGGAYLTVTRNPEPVAVGFPVEPASPAPTKAPPSAKPKQQARTAPPREAHEAAPQTAAPVPQPAPAAPQQSSSGLLAAMKEELFQLEVDRQRGAISEEEYKRTKATLDQTLALAIERAKRGTTA